MFCARDIPPYFNNVDDADRVPMSRCVRCWTANDLNCLLCRMAVLHS